MIKYKSFLNIIFFWIFFLGGIFVVFSQNHLSKEVLKKLNAYNVVWKTPSETGSMESMPLGNGDITANVWIEKNGDLMLYIGKSDSWSEATRLLKIGRVRINLDPNPFEGIKKFSETLNLHRGELNVVSVGQTKAELKIWIDANNPVIHIEVKGSDDMMVSSTTELLRPKPFTLDSPGDPLASSFRGVINSPVKPHEDADVLMSKNDRIEWYHRNKSSFYKTILTKQNAGELIGKYPDPYLNRTFGAAISGTHMKPINDSTLVSQKGKDFDLAIYSYTAQTPTAKDWDAKLDSIISTTKMTSLKKARQEHYAWWDNFWNRSWIFLSGDEEAKKVTNAYLLQRYMLACQSRGAYAVKFNGGSLTFDYKGKNGDYRNWGPGYWYQNTRLFYWPLTASGDYDLTMPWFNLYKNMLPLQTDITKLYYGHGGAFFPETYNFFGMYIQDDWGWNNSGKASETRWIRYHYSGALEMLSEMLDYYDYTRDKEFAKEYIIPFATQAIRFFDEHWPRINQKIRFIPANATEQFWDCLNPVDYIAGLKYTISKLNKLPKELVATDLLKEWNNCLQSLPPIPKTADGRKVLPAEEFGKPRNFENPECYTIFPFKLYGLGRPDMKVALNTFKDRAFKESNCWSQDVIQAPLLGLAEESKEFLQKNVNSLDPDVRFPAFWKPGSDYIPDFDNGGAFTMGLQNMLLQNVEDQILVLPAFPKSWNVDFKLHAFNKTVVRVKSEGTAISSLEVYPKKRKKDVVLPKKELED